ncbi:hypothetical protein TKK_0012128 [Trichogramma kaykai]
MRHVLVLTVVTLLCVFDFGCARSALPHLHCYQHYGSDCDYSEVPDDGVVSGGLGELEDCEVYDPRKSELEQECREQGYEYCIDRADLIKQGIKICGEDSSKDASTNTEKKGKSKTERRRCHCNCNKRKPTTITTTTTTTTTPAPKTSGSTGKSESKTDDDCDCEKICGDCKGCACKVCCCKC